MNETNTATKPALKWRNRISGILICLCIAVPAWLFGKAAPVIGGPVTAILIGIALSTAFPNLTAHVFASGATVREGVAYTSKKLLQVSIVLLGFEMNLGNIIRVGGESLLVMLFTLSAAFLTAYVMGKVLKLPSDTTTLIGVGTSICGGSAIAATAPIIGAKDEDVSRSISTIFLFNILAVFLFPALGHSMGMGDRSFGMWAGTAINDTSSVVAAATTWANAAGDNTALQFATIVKLTRTLMIVPITLVLALHTARKAKRSENGTFRFAKVFPWFVLLFVAAALVNTFAGLPVWLSSRLVTLGKFLIVMALAAIGLNTDLKKLFANGIKPIVLGLCCWFAVAGVSIVVQRVTGM